MHNTDTFSSVVSPATSAARSRIIKAATELFYQESIRSVGVDQIISRAHVTRVTFYRHFPSKDQLIVAYLEQKDAEIRTFIESATRSLSSSEAVLHAIITKIGEDACQPGARGCSFLNAAIEFPKPAHPVLLTVVLHRSWFRNTLTDLFKKAGHPRPLDAANNFVILRDGVMNSGYLDDPAQAFMVFTRQASRLVDAIDSSTRA